MDLTAAVQPAAGPRFSSRTVCSSHKADKRDCLQGLIVADDAWGGKGEARGKVVSWNVAVEIGLLTTSATQQYWV